MSCVSRYELRSEAGEVLSKHQTRTAALDNWRLHHVGERVWVWRTYSRGEEYLVVEGTWYRPLEPVT